MATYGKLLPSRKRRLALSFLGVNKTSPNVKKKSAENFIVQDGLRAWQPNGVLLGKILSENIEEQVPSVVKNGSAAFEFSQRGQKEDHQKYGRRNYNRLVFVRAGFHLHLVIRLHHL
jgi:hypothetical protein